MPREETEYTTITVPKRVKNDLDEHRNGQPWGSFLEELRREHADPLTINDVQELARMLEAELDSIGGGSSDQLDLIANRLDDIETQLPRRVAEELQG